MAASEIDQPLVAIYIYGDALDPGRITELMCVTPTKAWKKGERKPSRRPEGGAFAKTGLWMLRSKNPSEDVSDHIQELLAALKAAPSGPLRNIEGIEDAKLDIFLLSDGQKEIHVELTDEQLAKLASYGLRVTCTFGCLVSPPQES